MNSSEAIKKVIESLVLPKYPEITKVVIDSDSYYGRHYYRIYLGMKYEDLESVDYGDKLAEDIKDVAKFIMGPDERIEKIAYFDPEN